MMSLNDNPWISSINQTAESTVFLLSFKIRSIVSFALNGHNNLINARIFFPNVLALATPFSMFSVV